MLIAGIFRKDQLFFKWYGRFYKNLLHCFSAFFVQDQHSQSLLHSIGINNEVYLGGDTRFDRVIEIAKAFLPIDPIAHFCNNSLVLVAGSTWFQDDETIAHFEKANPHIKFIIAPHDITNQRLQNCLTLYKNAVLYSDYVQHLNEPNVGPQKFNTLIIDNVGMLSKLYHYASVSYIGGGFGADGIHNCLEAAVHYKPVLFGPVYDKYIEAVGLVEAGGAVSINDALDFESVAKNLCSNEVSRHEMGQIAGDFVHAHKGASAKPELLKKLIAKDVNYGYSLPLLLDHVTSIPGLILAPMNIMAQNTIDELGRIVPKDRLTHDQSWEWSSGTSVNSHIQRELLQATRYGFCIRRIISWAVATRRKYPEHIILVTKSITNLLTGGGRSITRWLSKLKPNYRRSKLPSSP